MMSNSPYEGLYDQIAGDFDSTIRSFYTAPPSEPLKNSLADYEMNFAKSGREGAFFQFSPRGNDALVAEAEKSGWKFHISVSPEHTGRALEIILEEIKSGNNPIPVKVANRALGQKFANPEYEQSGKVFTLYDGGSEPEQTQRLIQSIEDRFNAEGIQSGQKVKIDRPIPGSKFVSYTNDRSPEGKYIDGANRTGYNSSSKPDPYERFSIRPNTPQEPPIKVLHPSQQTSHSPETLHIASVLIAMGEPVHTNNGMHIPIHQLSEGQANAYKQTLKKLNIPFQENEKLAVGGQALSLSLESAALLSQAKNTAKTQVITDRNQQAALTLLGTNGQKTQNGDIHIPFPRYQSDHFTQALQTLNIAHEVHADGHVVIPAYHAHGFVTQRNYAANFVRQHATATHPSAAASGPTSSQQSSSAPSAGGAPTTNAQGAQTSSSSPSAPPQGPRASGGLQNQPHPSDGQAVTMGSLALKPEPVAPLDLQPNPTKQVVDPAKATPAANTARQQTPPTADTPHKQPASTKLGKVGGALGQAELGLTAAAQAAQGNVVGAATTVAEGVATNVAVGKASETAAKLLAKQGLKSAGVIVGAAATIGFGAATVIDKAKEGRYAAAAIEGATVLGEAAGNLLPGGVVGAGLRETFRAAVKHTIGEKYAPEKSGLRQAAELAADVGSKIVAQNQFKSMPTTKLREAIAHDETLPKTVAINGKSVALTEALDDKAFRTKFVENLEKAEAKGHDLGAQIAMIKAYDNRLAVPPPHVAAAQKPSPHVQMYGV